MRALSYVKRYVGMGHDAGSEVTLHYLNKTLAASGWEVNVLLSEPHPGAPSPYVVDGVTVVPHTSPEYLIQWIPYHDVLFTQHGPTRRCVYLSRETRIPLVQFIHNELQWSKGFLALGCDLAVYNSDHVRVAMESNLEEVVGVPIRDGEAALMNRECWAWDGIVVHPVVDPSEYTVTPDRKYITQIGLSKEKGGDIFWELARRNPQWQFLAVHNAYGDPIVNTLPNVRILEHTPNIQMAYEQTKVLLMPSTRESYGRTAIEAACSGVPTICSGTDGLREALGDAGMYATSVDDYNTQLLKLHSASWLYAQQCKKARQRAAELWEQSQKEIPLFINEVTRVVNATRPLRR